MPIPELADGPSENDVVEAPNIEAEIEAAEENLSCSDLDTSKIPEEFSEAADMASKFLSDLSAGNLPTEADVAERLSDIESFVSTNLETGCLPEDALAFVPFGPTINTASYLTHAIDNSEVNDVTLAQISVGLDYYVGLNSWFVNDENGDPLTMVASAPNGIQDDEILFITVFNEYDGQPDGINYSVSFDPFYVSGFEARELGATDPRLPYPPGPNFDLPEYQDVQLSLSFDEIDIDGDGEYTFVEIMWAAYNENIEVIASIHGG